MHKTGEHIEDLFGKAFRDAEITPPSHLWESLESSLEKEHAVETLFKKTFVNTAIQPSKKIWYRISYILFLRGFLTFKPTTFNAYYAALTAIVGVVCVSIWPFQKSTTQETKNTNIEIVSNTIQKQIISEQPQETAITKTAPVINQKSTTESEKLMTNNIEQKHTKVEVSAPIPLETFDFSKVRIIGATKICSALTAEYAIEGVPVESEIEWNLQTKDGIIKYISTRKISASWNKGGSYSIWAYVKVGNTKKKIELPVTVEENVEPIIKGKNKVCEGTEKQLYSVDEPVDKNIVYEWKTTYNAIDFIGNKYINVDWKKSGRDTLFVSRINSETGCKSQSAMLVTILPKPIVDFEMTPLGNSEFQFMYTGPIKKGVNIEWSIDGNEFNDQTIVYENKGIGNTTVTLKVTDKNNCSTILQREVSFNKHIIFVPRQFNLDNNDGFMPQTNQPLKSYKIEIYNPRNEKIWESTDLTNGKPSKAWDGTYKGTQVARGKYMWRIKAVFDDGTEWKGIMQPTGELKPSGIIIIDN
jgi:hypothetical protein